MFARFAARRPPVIRDIGVKDAAACAAIHARSFAYPWNAAEFEALLAGRDVVAEAALVTARARFFGRGLVMAGFILSRLVLDEAEILTFAVAPKFRRRGMGGDLMRTHLATLAARGAKALFLEVDAGNHAALALYDQFEFHQIGTRKAYYRAAEGPAAAAFTLKREFM